VRDFVGTVAEAGCTVFIVHARNAWLQGLSPKENREIPPLRYELVHQLKPTFRSLTIAINGGMTTERADRQQLQHLDGVMVGREAYHNPWWLAAGTSLLRRGAGVERPPPQTVAAGRGASKGAGGSPGASESLNVDQIGHFPTPDGRTML
jgi:tRNA-dihydrouridine synthase